MQIRPLQASDIGLLGEIDGTIESSQYLHVERSGEGLETAWKLHERPFRERLIRPNPLDDERRFALKQVATGNDEGIATMAEHEDVPVALLLATPDPVSGVLCLRDLRVDSEYRRQGLATALLLPLIGTVRGHAFRAVSAETTTDNLPAARLLAKCGFEIAGLDTMRTTNHDLVKESVTLFWYVGVE